jgi:D-alanine-D-alanine ligase
MKKLRVIVLMHEDLVPPENVSGSNIESASWRTEYDILRTLKDLGHEVQALGIRSDLEVIRKAIVDFKPHVAFNLLEEFDGHAVFDQNVVSFLELLRVPYTGCNPRGLMLARDKALSKKILTFHRIQTPDFFVLPIGRKVKRPKRMNFPLIVKSLVEEASLGISQASVVYSDQELKERAIFIHEKIGTDALIEQFIDGRELYASIMGNSRLQVFKVWELLFKKMPDNMEKIATAKVKWDVKYQKRCGISSAEADLPEDIMKKIIDISKRTYHCLGFSGYARIDIRLGNSGDVYVIEANPNPQIAQGEDFAEAAKKSGISYSDLIQKTLTLGLSWATSRSG